MPPSDPRAQLARDWLDRAERDLRLARLALGDGCDGRSFRQHNEPAGGQDVWHYHLHVFPRYVGDDQYVRTSERTTPDEREPYARKLRDCLALR